MYLRDQMGTEIAMEGSTHFQYEVHWTDPNGKFVLREYSSVAKNPCFGDLTSSLPSHQKVSGYVRIYFNNYYNRIEQLAKDVAITESNIGTALNPDLFNLLFHKLRTELQSFVPHTARVLEENYYPISNYDYEDHKDFVIADKCIIVEFRNSYYYEIFFLLNMYRRLITFDTIRSVLAAYELYEEQWKHLSFVQLLLISDFCNRKCTPTDSLIGMIYFSNLQHLCSLLTIEKFKDIKNYIPNYTSGRYSISYSSVIVDNPGNIRTEQFYFKPLRAKYKLPQSHWYDTFEDVCIQECKPEDCESLKILYMFLQQVIKQNNKTQDK